MPFFRSWLAAAVLVALAGCTGGAGGSGPLPPPSSLKACVDPAYVAPPRQPAQARNVLFIFTEDQGLQLGALGTAGLATPNMDRLAAEGLLLTAAHVSLATCTGSKSSIFTGFTNHSSGANGNVEEYVGPAEQLAAENPAWLGDPNSAYNRFRIRPEVPTLIERLHAEGWFTGLQNKFHLAPHTKFPYDRWYDNDATSYAQVSRFIAEARTLDRPWFLTHVIGNSHRPYPNLDSGPVGVDPSRVEVPPHLPDTSVARQDWAEYLAAVQIADGRVGQALQALADSGAESETLVVFMGDHGPGYHRGKFTTYGFGLRAPVVFRGPGIPAATRSDAVFSNVDLFPTLLDVLGLEPSPSQGVSFRPLLTGVSAAGPRLCAVGEAASDRSIFDGRYRPIETPVASDTVIPADARDFSPWRNRVYSHIRDNAATPGFELAYRLLDLADRNLTQFQRPALELYDTQLDPWEIDDHADDPALATVRMRLAQQLDQWRADTLDTAR